MSSFVLEVQYKKISLQGKMIFVAMRGDFSKGIIPGNCVLVSREGLFWVCVFSIRTRMAKGAKVFLFFVMWYE